MIDSEEYHERIERWDELSEEEQKECEEYYRAEKLKREMYPERYVQLVHHVDLEVEQNHAAFIKGIDWNKK